MASTKEKSAITAKRLLVAGAAGSLGLATVRHFAAAGLSVTAACRTIDEAQRIEGLIAEAGRAARVKVAVADLGDEAAVKRLVEEATKAYGGIDAVINCAGGFRWSKVTDTSVEDFDFLLDANLRSSYLLARHAMPVMRQQGFGRFVLISSRATLAPAEPGFGVYAATKAGINALVQALAAEHRGSGVTVNAIAPTVIDTPANRRDMPDADPEDWVSLEALTQLMAMLIGPEGKPYNGAIIPIAGNL